MITETNEPGESQKCDGYERVPKQSFDQKICRWLALPDSTVSYPSQSLRFLENLDEHSPLSRDMRNGSKDPAPARMRLNIIVVGGGLGGLAVAIALARRGHSVQILEQALKLGEVYPTNRTQMHAEKAR